jgi:hypothetical protein
MKFPTPSLERLCLVVDETLEAVERAAVDPLVTAVRDMNDTFLGATYGRAYRCMRSIRELAGRGEADDAMILTRSLLMTVARAFYLVAPSDRNERARRFASWQLTSARQTVHIFDDLSATGFGPSDGRERFAQIVEAEEARGTQPLPPERQLFRELGLEPFYARVFRIASDTVHYTTRTLNEPKTHSFSRWSLTAGSSSRPNRSFGTASRIWRSKDSRPTWPLVPGHENIRS